MPPCGCTPRPQRRVPAGSARVGQVGPWKSPSVELKECFLVVPCNCKTWCRGQGFKLNSCHSNEYEVFEFVSDIEPQLCRTVVLLMSNSANYLWILQRVLPHGTGRTPGCSYRNGIFHDDSAQEKCSSNVQGRFQIM